jgi:hypothetical protein
MAGHSYQWTKAPPTDAYSFLKRILLMVSLIPKQVYVPGMEFSQMMRAAPFLVSCATWLQNNGVRSLHMKISMFIFVVKPNGEKLQAVK